MSAHIIEEDGGCRLRWNHNSAYYPELVSCTVTPQQKMNLLAA